MFCKCLIFVILVIGSLSGSTVSSLTIAHDKEPSRLANKSRRRDGSSKELIELVMKLMYSICGVSSLFPRKLLKTL